MARTKVVIVYSPSQAKRRGAVLIDDDSEIPMHAANLKPGEAALVGSLSDYHTIGPDAMLARYLGRAPVSDRCAVVNAAGVVVSFAAADPAIDRHPDGVLYHDPHAKAKIGKLLNIPLI